jgi:hypothetical protein
MRIAPYIVGLTAAALIALSATAQVPSEFERILLPLSVGGAAGAYGTVWSTELWYRNNSTRPMIIFPVAVSDYVTTVGRTSFLPVGWAPAAAPGQFLFVSRDGADQVQFDLRLFNLANPSAAWGTKLPVVREREFADSASLINVPTGTAFRSTLRIYGLADGSVVAPVDVRVYSYEEKLLTSKALLLEGVPPYAAILSLADTFPEIRQVERVRIEVVSGQIKIWAFVSVTSNTTQDVSLVTP